MFPAPLPPDIINNNVMPTTGWGSPVIWSSVLVAVIALIGVVVTNIVSGKNMFKAETQRAAAAIAAEEKRAETALEAERIRHEHAVVQRNIEWQREAKTASYAQLTLVCQDAVNFMVPFVWDLDRMQRGVMGREGLPEMEVKIDGLLNELLKAYAHTQIVGHSMVTDVADEWFAKLQGTALDAIRASRKPEENYDPRAYQRRIDEVVGDVDTRLITLIRADLRGELPGEEFWDPVPKEGTEDDSPAADLPEPSLDPANA